MVVFLIGLKSLPILIYWDVVRILQLFRAQAVKYFAHHFLNITCSGPQGGGLSFLLGKLKDSVKTYVDLEL